MAAKTQNWANINAVLGAFWKARPITAGRCVLRDEGPRGWFEIRGGKCCLVVVFKFSARVGFIKFMRTRATRPRVSYDGFGVLGGGHGHPADPHRGGP